MATNTLIKLANLISKLPDEDLNTLYEMVCSFFAGHLSTNNPNCPYCNCNHIVKNGHKCGKQEYFCKDCGKTFVSTTNTLMAYSHQPREVWEEVIKDTISGDAISFTAKRLGISHDCIFNMRHKFLLAICQLQAENGECLSDVSELDETFVLDSYKGRKLPSFVVRKARKHGAKVEKRGISKEYICICTGVQCKGCAIAKTVNRAKPSSKEMQEIFGNRIENGTLILCDRLKSYHSLEKGTGCSVKDKNTEAIKEFYNLNTVNNFHSFIKDRYEFYRGVATKYLNRYNALFSLAYRYTADKIKWLCHQLLDVSCSSRHISCKDVKSSELLLI